MSEAANKIEEPHYQGHRDRLRERFLKSGIEALHDYEILELILFMAIPRRDVKPLAKSLLQHFGSFAMVLNATASELEQFGLSENSITALKVIKASSLQLLRQETHTQQILNSWSRLLDYLRASMGFENKEIFRILFLNKKNYLIADEIQGTGTIDHTHAYPREIMKRALELGATSIILVHNHPSGDLTPSQDDIDMTQSIIMAGTPLGVTVHDHVIVSKNGARSLKSMGLL